MKMMPFAFVTALILAVVIGLAAHSRAGDAPPPAAAVGRAAPGFSLQDQDGKKVSLADFKGKIVVLEWTNPDCPFVQRHYEAKTMAKLAARYKDRGVAWLAIHSGDGTTAEADRQWAKSNKMAYPLLDDGKGAAGKAYGAKSTPHMFIIDKEGKLAYTGAIDNDPDGDKTDGRVNYVEKALDELLAGKPVTTPETKSYGCSVHFAE